MDYLLGILAAIQAIGETEPMVAIVVCVSLVLIALIAAPYILLLKCIDALSGKKTPKKKK